MCIMPCKPHYFFVGKLRKETKHEKEASQTLGVGSCSDAGNADACFCNSG